MRSGGLPAGSGRALRLDPFALPVRFAASDAAADERVRHVELHRERVVVRRSLAGMRMALNMPVSAFTGVAIRLLPGEAQASVILEHKDPALAVPLCVSAEADEALVQWRVWGNVLGLPLLIAEADGAFREPFARLGQLRVERPRPRRRRRSSFAQAQADDADAAQSRPAHRRNAGAPRRARDHRAQLNIS